PHLHSFPTRRSSDLTTYFGFSKGAKQANHAVVSLCPRTVACAVPVFPATTQSFKRALPPVPPSSLTTFQRPLRTSAIWSGEISYRKSDRARGGDAAGLPCPSNTGKPSCFKTLSTNRG